MRLLHIFRDEKEAQSFASVLSNEGIDNRLEIFTNTDWGSDDYGTISSKLWVVDEDKVDTARQLLDLFLKNPDDPRFTTPKNLPAFSLEPYTIEEETRNLDEQPIASQRQRQQQLGIITFYLIIGCVLLFFLSHISAPTPQPSPSQLPTLPLFSSQIEKGMLYDYPAAYEILDKLIKSYGLEQVLHPDTLSTEGTHILRQFYNTPFWRGLYPRVVNYFRTGASIQFDTPMFEKINQGEVWRLFTPTLLHSDIFHLLFNMIWLLVLGKQIEYRVGKVRYLLFILITGIFSNTAQYLMSGPDFIGFSGILCAMITFVWFRQKHAAWEGYQLLPVTMAFITVFIFAMASIQLISFFFEISSQTNIIGTNIANTAHLSGAFVGILLAFSNFFAWKN